MLRSESRVRTPLFKLDSFEVFKQFAHVGDGVDDPVVYVSKEGVVEGIVFRLDVGVAIGGVCFQSIDNVSQGFSDAVVVKRARLRTVGRWCRNGQTAHTEGRRPVLKRAAHSDLQNLVES